MEIGEPVLVKTDNTKRFLWTVCGFGTCRSCGADVLWCETHHGKKTPVDPPDSAESATTSHFVTCEHANHWRKS